MELSTVIVILAVLFVAQSMLLLAGLRRLKDRPYGSATPRVSVVVAARNEEAAIGDCLASLVQQTYPRDRHEIIVVDDDSTDRTGEIVREIVRSAPHVRLVRPQEGSLRGKSRALAAGIASATGEVIMITDADCQVRATWIADTARRFEPDVGLIGGFTLQDASTRFGAIQSLDWTMLLGIASSAVGWGTSFGSIGNNLSFRKEAYNAVGGYPALPFSVTEDYTLVQAILRTGKWVHLYPIDPAIVVESRPCPNWASLAHQKHRWGRGGLDVKLIGFLIMAVAWLLNVLPIVHTIIWGAWAHTLTVYLVKASCDYAFLYAVLRRLHRTEDLRHFAAFQAYYLAYVVILPFAVFLGGKVRWKGRVY